MIEQDLKFIIAVFNWATRARDDDGQPLLERNPFHGLSVPREKNPNRPSLTDTEYQRLLAVADEIDWRFKAMLVLAHETGHRIGAIRQLRWSDVDLASRTIRWPEGTEKTGYGHITPMTEDAASALRDVQFIRPGIGDAPIFPAPKDASVPVDRWLPRRWWQQAEKRAELQPSPGRGWHSLRRKFASDLMDQPLKVLCELGGWRDHNTILKCYQQPDQDELRAALSSRGAQRLGA